MMSLKHYLNLILGLIILRALYGKFVSDEFEEGKCIDVTIPIQYQVRRGASAVCKPRVVYVML